MGRSRYRDVSEWMTRDPLDPNSFDDPSAGFPLAAGGSVPEPLLDRAKSAGGKVWGVLQGAGRAAMGARDKVFDYYGEQDPYSEFLTPEQRRKHGQSILQDYGSQLMARSGPTALPSGASAFGSAWQATQANSQARMKQAHAAQAYRRELARRDRIGGIDPNTPDGRSAMSREAAIAGEYGDSEKWSRGGENTAWKRLPVRREGREMIYEEQNEVTGEVRRVSSGSADRPEDEFRKLRNEVAQIQRKVLAGEIDPRASDMGPRRPGQPRPLTAGEKWTLQNYEKMLGGMERRYYTPFGNQGGPQGFGDIDTGSE